MAMEEHVVRVLANDIAVTCQRGAFGIHKGSALFNKSFSLLAYNRRARANIFLVKRQMSGRGNGVKGRRGRVL